MNLCPKVSCQPRDLGILTLGGLTPSTWSPVRVPASAGVFPRTHQQMLTALSASPSQSLPGADNTQLHAQIPAPSPYCQGRREQWLRLKKHSFLHPRLLWDGLHRCDVLPEPQGGLCAGRTTAAAFKLRNPHVLWKGGTSLYGWNYSDILEVVKNTNTKHSIRSQRDV